MSAPPLNSPLAGLQADQRRGAGAVERGGLENRCARERTEGSNPSLSAIKSLFLLASRYGFERLVRFPVFRGVWCSRAQSGANPFQPDFPVEQEIYVADQGKTAPSELPQQCAPSMLSRCSDYIAHRAPIVRTTWTRPVLSDVSADELI